MITRHRVAARGGAWSRSNSTRRLSTLWPRNLGNCQPGCRLRL